jgi:hypothetical protein
VACVEKLVKVNREETVCFKDLGIGNYFTTLGGHYHILYIKRNNQEAYLLGDYHLASTRLKENERVVPVFIEHISLVVSNMKDISSKTPNNLMDVIK